VIGAIAGTARAQQGPPSAPTAVYGTGISGIVVDSAGLPIAGARLTVRDTVRSVDGEPRRLTTASDSLGRFRLMGFEAGAYVLEVQRDAYEPAGFQFVIAGGMVAELKIVLVRDPFYAELLRAADSLDAAERAEAIAQRRDGRVQGRVATPDKVPVADAEVQALGTSYTVKTDSTGAFQFSKLPVGPYYMRVRKLGYDPTVFSAIVVPGDSLSAEVTLTPFAPNRLATVRVTAAANTLRSRRMEEFDRRRRVSGGAGVFIDAKEIAQRQPSYISDLLRGRANVRIERDQQTGDNIVYGRGLSISSGACPLAIMIDGVLVRNLPGTLDGFVPVQMVSAIEVYNSGTRVPGEFSRIETDCGVVVIWTK
jgi:hypothetical protein